MFYHSSIGATANLLLSAQRNAFSLTSSTLKVSKNAERCGTKDFYRKCLICLWSSTIIKNKISLATKFHKICKDKTKVSL